MCLFLTYCRRYSQMDPPPLFLCIIINQNRQIFFGITFRNPPRFIRHKNINRRNALRTFIRQHRASHQEISVGHNGVRPVLALRPVQALLKRQAGKLAGPDEKAPWRCRWFSPGFLLYPQKYPRKSMGFTGSEKQKNPGDLLFPEFFVLYRMCLSACLVGTRIRNYKLINCIYTFFLFIL